MDKDVVGAKLETLRRCIRRIEEKTPATPEALSHDYDLQDIICINLERAVQVSVDLAAHVTADRDLPAPTTMAESFEQLARLGLISADLALRLRKAVGFRNVAVHAYQQINWAMVYSIVTTRLDDFRDFAKAVAHTAGL